MSPARTGCALERAGQAHDALLVGVADAQRTLAVGEHLLEHHDLADGLELEGVDDVERLVEHDLLALAKAGSTSTVGLTLTRSLRPPVKMSMVPSSLAWRKVPKPGRRLGEPVDLLLQRDDLVAGLTQGVGQALVLRGDRGQGALHVGEPLLEEAGAARARP